MTHPEHAQALHAMLAATAAVLQRHPGTRPYLLADGAWLRHGSAFLRASWSRIAGTPLLGDDEAGWAGPLLFPLALDGNATEPLEPLLDPETLLPFGSILCSAMEPPRLATHLLPLADVLLDEGLPMLMRFADPRVTPFWLDALEGPYRHYVADCASAWVHWQPDLSVRAWADGDPYALASGLQFPMPLTEAQQQAMIDACFVYFIQSSLMEGRGSSVIKALPAQRRFAFLEDQLRRAMHWGFASAPDLQAWCITAIAHGARFDETPVVADVLRTEARKGWETVVQAWADRGWPRPRTA